MKLSEMNSVQFAETIAKICDPVEKIMNDQKFYDSLVGYFGDARNGTQPPLIMITNAVTNLMPSLLSNHQNETFAIVSALTGKTVEQIRNQRGIQTVKDIKDSFDRELIDFFTSSKRQE